jgi:UDP-3-O-[3-hydroxymyristoyl] N-acetylglucosamine deacetylase
MYSFGGGSSAALIFEQTIRMPAECHGVGLHGGAPVNLRILPAPAGTGIVFRRVDLDDFTVEANIHNLAKVSYATSLMKKGVLISTTEHLLSAFMGAGVDNAVVELDNLELPILDGSAVPFVQMLQQAGIKAQRRRRTCLRVIRNVEIRDGDKSIVIQPAESYSVEYRIAFPEPIGRSSFAVELSCDRYCREIAPARTFGFRKDEQAMRNMGLVRGASMENCIVVAASGPENGPLRFRDEYVRHKILDLIGDLALLGHRIVGRVIADRAGHAMHTALVQRLVRDHSLWEETAEDDSPVEEVGAAAPHALA